jgi:hypothetical protein
MSGSQRVVSFVLACASSVIGAGAQSQTTRGPEVKKLEVMVGRFTVEDELKAGVMGPNSHRRLQMDGRRLRRDLLGSTPHGRKEIYGNFLHLLRSDCQDLPISRS